MPNEKKYTTPRGSAATRAKAKYNAKAYDSIKVNVPKGQREVIDQAAKDLGYSSRNEFILDAIKKLMEAQYNNAPA